MTTAVAFCGVLLFSPLLFDLKFRPQSKLSMFWIDFVSRFTHVSTAIVLVGGSLFTLVVLMPAAKALSDEAHAKLAAGIAARWKRFVHVGILLFLVSGFYNYFRAMPLHRGDGLYHALVGTKIILALGVFFIASALVGRSPALASFRANRKRWLATLVLLATSVVVISSFVKVKGGSHVQAGESESMSVETQ